MIENERQYRVTRKAVEHLERTLLALKQPRPRSGEIHPVLLDAEEAAIHSQLDDLRAELRTYEARRVS